MRHKTLRFDTYEASQRCMYKLFNLLMRRRGEFTAEQTLAQLVGKTVELATATNDKQQRAKIIDAALDSLAADDDQNVAATLQRVETCIARSDEMRAVDDGMKVLKQRQFVWFDEETTWKLLAKPDFVRFTRDKFGPVIQIVDEKIAGHVTKHQKRFLLFLGLVISLQLDEEMRLAFAAAKQHDIPVTYTVRKNTLLGELVDHFGIEVVYRKPSIEMVIRLLGDNENEAKPREISIGFKKRTKDFEQLEEIRAVIRKIEEAFATNEFLASVTWNCGGCPFRSTCEAYQASLAANHNDNAESLAETA